jgi:predicted nucleic-acid-binding Zn-ribbon protein
MGYAERINVEESFNCSKCGGEMLEGFILDTGQYASLVSTWHAGKPNPSFWTGIKFEKELMRRVVTYCCDHCGYLESYARNLDYFKLRKD